MQDSTNPFTMRSSESIENDLTFLRLFGTAVLDIVPDSCFSHKVTIFRSGPGGGKTSLLRLFRPESLNEIYNHGVQYKELHEALENYSILSEYGPKLLGIYLRLSDYTSFDDLHIEEQEKDSYLFSLLGSRLILKMLQGILELKNLELSDLSRIHIDCPVGDQNLTNSPLPCDGATLYKWASKLEQNISGIANRFDHSFDKSIPIYQNLDHIWAMLPKYLKLDNELIVSNTLIMFDDLQLLRKNQRKKLLDKVTQARFPVPIWFAERLDALDLYELAPGIHGREYNSIYLEEYWERSKGKTFETFVKSISNKRAQFANLEFDIDSLYQHLENSIDNTDWSTKFKMINSTINEKLHKTTRHTNMYDEWLDEQENQKIQSPMKSALDWRSLEIKIAREEKSSQKKLFDIPLDPDDDDDVDLSLTPVSEYFLHEEYGVPYYFGFSNIAKISSSNVEQFLEIASELFEQLISQLIKSKKNEILSAAKQESIIKKIAKRHWDEIPKKNLNGRDIEKFLSSFKDFTRSETLQPNAPYVPGVTGIGIRKSLYDKIIDPDSQKKYPELRQLANVLQTCISQNYLKVRYRAKQGKKFQKNHKLPDEVTLLYLNRLLCVHFGLPLGKGGWRPKKPDELCKWLGHSDPLRGMK